jgi:hypothetical protein
VSGEKGNHLPSHFSLRQGFPKVKGKKFLESFERNFEGGKLSNFRLHLQGPFSSIAAEDRRWRPCQPTRACSGITTRNSSTSMTRRLSRFVLVLHQKLLLPHLNFEPLALGAGRSTRFGGERAMRRGKRRGDRRYWFAHHAHLA